MNAIQNSFRFNFSIRRQDMSLIKGFQRGIESQRRKNKSAYNLNYKN